MATLTQFVCHLHFCCARILEVPRKSECVLQHVQTGSFLSSDRVAYQTLFGCEFEVCGHAALSTNKTQNLNAERKGDITGDYALRRHLLPNIWTVATA